MSDLDKNEAIKHDDDKPLIALIPPSALEAEARVWTFGAKKYSKWNWNKGITYTRILSAILRHTMAIMKGENVDFQSGELHAAHIRCNAAMLIEFTMTNRVELDDRMDADRDKGGSHGTGEFK
jgi:Domain of unknown function (DUF5664)